VDTPLEICKVTWHFQLHFGLIIAASQVVHNTQGSIMSNVKYFYQETQSIHVYISFMLRNVQNFEEWYKACTHVFLHCTCCKEHSYKIYMLSPARGMSQIFFLILGGNIIIIMFNSTIMT
jgi:hypothetical protein